MQTALNRILLDLSSNLQKTKAISFLVHALWTIVGALFFVAIASIVAPLKLFVQLWNSSEQLTGSSVVPVLSLILAVAGFVSGSWAVGSALAHGMHLIVAKARSNEPG